MSVVPPFRAKKAFGQHFLVQQSAIRSIVDAARASSASAILEIGPGPGVLTAPLLEDGRDLWAVDLDPEVCEHLRQRFAGQDRFHLIEGDAVTVGLPQAPAMKGGTACSLRSRCSPLDPTASSWSVVGNLPYNAATAILGRFLLEPIPWERMVLMFQLEVGQKLLGRPSEKAYGPLSVLAQACCRMTRLLKLGPRAFNPPPKVDSVVILFESRPEAPDHAFRRRLHSLLWRSFAKRRKTLANNWQGWLEAPRIAELLAAQDLSPSIRAEAVPPEAWLSLTARLQPELTLPGAP
jgi:16S rRNA (adenine1518-N6/adenine1519-N6)-dimethyltransferase